MHTIKNLAHKLWKLLRIPTKLQLALMRRSQDSFLVGVTGIILNDENEIMFLKHTYRAIEWSLPGGYVKAKEHPEAALVREIKEESNLNVKIKKRLPIWSDKLDARIDIPFVGIYMGGKFKASPEVSEVKFFSPFELPPILDDQKKLIAKVIEGDGIIVKKSSGIHIEVLRKLIGFNKYFKIRN